MKLKTWKNNKEKIIMTEQITSTESKNHGIETKKKNIIIGGYACLGTGLLLMCFSLFLASFIYVPLFIISTLLGVVCLVKDQVLQGILMILSSFILPLIFAIVLVFVIGANVLNVANNTDRSGNVVVTSVSGFEDF